LIELAAGHGKTGAKHPRAVFVGQGLSTVEFEGYVKAVRRTVRKGVVRNRILPCRSREFYLVGKAFRG